MTEETIAEEEEIDCATYGCDWQAAWCEYCNDPECYVVCENCGEEEYQQCGGPE